MASFFSNILKPYESNKIHVVDYVNSEHYYQNVDKLRPRLIASLSSIAHDTITMQFRANVYVFTENELKELLQNR